MAAIEAGGKTRLPQKAGRRWRPSRRGVQVTLGVLWLLDGALQLQHQMFTGSFASQVLAPSAQGQPGFVAGPIHFGIRVFLMHPAVFDALFALMQLVLGALILWKRTVRFGLFASVAWSLIVWVFGEGYGGIFSGQTSLLMGAPGAAILYAILALAVLPSSEKTDQSKNREPAYWLAFVWLIIWIGGAVYQLLPGQNSVSDMSSMIAGNAAGAPGWLAPIDAHVAEFINGFATSTHSMTGLHMSAMQMARMPTEAGSGYWFIVLLAVVQLLIGLGILARGVWRKSAIAAGVILSLVFWVIGQNLGEYYSGLATDPSTAPLIILLGLAVAGCRQLDQKLRFTGKRIERLLVAAPKPDS